MAKNNGKSVISRFIGSKNTVTILGVLACIATLIIGFNYRVNQSSASVLVPYAKKDIPAKTLMTRILILPVFSLNSQQTSSTPKPILLRKIILKNSFKNIVFGLNKDASASTLAILFESLICSMATTTLSIQFPAANRLTIHWQTKPYAKPISIATKRRTFIQLNWKACLTRTSLMFIK